MSTITTPKNPRSYPSIDSPDFWKLIDAVHEKHNDGELVAAEALIEYVDRHVDGLRLYYESRVGVEMIQPGTEVYVVEAQHLVRNGRVYGHRVTEIAGQEPVVEYRVQLFYHNLDISDCDMTWENASHVFVNASEAFNAKRS
jgi:hypothetical protein